MPKVEASNRPKTNEEDFPTSKQPTNVSNFSRREDFEARADRDTAQSLNVHLDEGRKISPNLAARVSRMQTKSGLPNSVVAQNIDDLESRNEDSKFTPNFWRTSPLTAKYIRDASPFYSGMNDDDILNLGNTEQLIGTDPALWRKPQSFIDKEVDTFDKKIQAEISRRGRGAESIPIAPSTIDPISGEEFSPEVQAENIKRHEADLAKRREDFQLRSDITFTSGARGIEGISRENLDTVLETDRKVRVADFRAQLEFEEDFIASDAEIGGFEFLEKRARENGSFLVPFISSGADTVKLAGLYKAAIAVEEGTASDEQHAMLVRYGRLAEAAERRGMSVTGITASIAAEAIPFATELYLTAGVYTTGKALGEKALRASLEKLLRTSVGKVLKRKLPLLGGRVGEFAIRNSSRIAGVLAQAPVAGLGRIPRGVVQDITPIGTTQFGEDGSVSFRVVPNSGKPFGVALTQNVYSQFTAVGTERIGGPLGRLGKKLTSKALAKFPAVQKLFKSFVVQGGKADEFIKTMQTAGIHGILSEFAEEEVDKYLQDIGGIQKYEWPTAKELKGQALAFGAPTLVSGGFRVADRFATKRTTAAANEQFLLDLGESVLKDEVMLTNNPIEYKRILHDKVEGTNMESAKMPIEQFNQALEGKKDEEGRPIKPREVIVDIMGDGKVYDEALETGGDIVIPMEEYATTLNIGEFSQDLSKVVKFNEADSTSAETEKLLNDLEANLEVQQVELQDQEKRVEAINSAKRVADDIRSQFDETSPKFNIVTADNYARLYERVFRTLGLQNGVDPLELYEDFKLSITEHREAGSRAKRKEEDERTEEELNAAIVEQMEAIEALENQRKTVVGELSDVETIADPIEVAGRISEIEQQERESRKVIKKAERRLREIGGEADGGFFFQGDPKNVGIVAGNFSMGGNHSVSIDLFKDAGLNTFLHESGHFFLEILNELSLKEGANPKTVQDMDAIKTWFKSTPFEQVVKEVKGESDFLQAAAKKDPSLVEAAANSKEALKMVTEGGKEFVDAFIDSFGENVDQKFWNTLMTPFHEQWARGFELYLADPKNAPTPELKSMFYRFRKWVIDFYNRLLNLNVELSQDIKDVMGRLLATSEEMEEAQAEQGMVPLFPDPVAAGMTQEQADSYQTDVNAALEKATEELNSKAIEMDLRKKSKTWRERKKIVQAEVTQEANQERVYIALSNMQRGKNPDGSELDSGVIQVKLNKKQMQDLLGAERFGNLPRGITAKDGVNPSFGASLLGYEKIEELILEVELSPKKSEYIEAETNRRLNEELGDPLSPDVLPDEVNDALHNEKRSQVLKKEIDFLASENLSTLKGLVKRVATPIPTIPEVRLRAQQIIGKKDVGQISPITYKRGESKASRLAIESLIRGDIQESMMAKQLELLNHELYREAVKARQAVDKELSFTAKLRNSDKKLAKNRDMGMVNTARSILAAYKVGNFDAQFVEDNLNYLKTYGGATDNNDAHFVLNKMREKAMIGSGDFKTSSFDQFQFMMLTVRAFWKLSKAVKTIEIKGKAVSADEVAQQFVDALATRQNFKPGSLKLLNPFSHTDRKTFKEGFFAAANYLKRMEFWVDKMDDGNPRGIFHKFLWNPIIEASTDYRVAFNEAKAEYRTLLESVSDTLLPGNIEAKELPKEISEEDPNGFYTFADKAALLGALLHIGNKSNLSKLVRGRKWGGFNEEGILDTSNWDRFLTRMIDEKILTEKDFQFAQGVWDLFDKAKKKAQQTHFAEYGFHFNEITAHEVITPFGNFKGGYAPATLDYADFEHVSEVDGQPVTDQQMANSAFSDMFPQTQKGMTLDRDEFFAGPLQFDLGYVTSNLDKVFRFAHLTTPVRNAYNLVNHAALKGDKNTKVQGALSAFDPTVIKNLIMPWLVRVAKQQVTKPSEIQAAKLTDSFFRTLRRRTVNSLMFINTVNILEQVTDLAASASVVRPKYLQRALKDVIQHPKDTAAEVKSLSKFMSTRDLIDVMQQDSVMKEMLINPTKSQKVSEFADKYSMFGQMMLQGFIDTVVWKGAAIQAAESTTDFTDNEIILIADSVIRRTQGDYNPESISAVESQGAFVKFFITFYGYFNTRANLLTSQFAISKRTSETLGQKRARNFWIYFTAVAIPAIASASISRLLREGADADNDDELLDDALDVLIMSQIEMGTAMLPDGGTVQYMFNQWDDKWWNDSIGSSPALSQLEKILGTPKSVIGAITGEGKPSKALKDVGAVLSALTGIPTTQFTKTGGFFIDLANDDQEAESFDDFLRGVIGGRSGRK